MEDITFKKGREETLLKTPIFTVLSREETAADGYTGKYVALDTADWVIAVAKDKDKFVLVRQWRHGMGALSLEFPGGVAEKGESPCETAARELREETGYRAGKTVLLGSLNPNPAMFTNKVHFVLCEELTAEGDPTPDGDERIQTVRMSPSAMLRSFGGGEYVHALMAAAFSMYLKYLIG